ncbi:MAG: tRNA uridine(34) 5-carboxymethylaminomethyl modification radical SAM/GNAT enzyme Elp3 [Chloroflexi bacterium]|nr:tRNA uridine(34) 5-carboxymethylaminomethyl modification radical SAM/GNAT enzyme Elp3 [Chloroflexota bacterium]
MKDKEKWVKDHALTPQKLEIAHHILLDMINGSSLGAAQRRHPTPDGAGYLAKHFIVAEYHNMVESGALEESPSLLASIRMKPVRTLSGVTTVTVLTRSHPCPGDCIFCPTDARMPKSYLPDEPGAARAFENDFDPYRQVKARLDSLEAVGHPTDKIELLILGGTWDAYPRDYQAWFIQRCLDAMNGAESANLKLAQQINETANHRNVGLVIETRPDYIQPAELAWLRSLGVTKIQMGAQSLDEEILKKNRRGHTAAQTLAATSLLRAAGYKTVLHWMPNLLGATPESDRTDFVRLWQGYCPDEIKIYPTQLLETAELYRYWQNGEYQPYTMEELISLVADIKPTVPIYCRINRIIRDIPSHHVVTGNRRTSLRQDAGEEMTRRGNVCRCIRCREVRGQQVETSDLRLDDFIYDAAWAQEHFLQYVTPDDHIAGYLRLSLPDRAATARCSRLPVEAAAVQQDLLKAMPELEGAALIREVHVYGQSLGVGEEQSGAAQHRGLGRQLIERAGEIARERGFSRLAVISAIGTRLYYEHRGFERGELYQIKKI